ELARGELRTEIARLAERSYVIPGSDRTRIGPKTLEGWYYAFRKAGLEPKPRTDRGASKIPLTVQEAILVAKRDNPKRSIRQLRLLMGITGITVTLYQIHFN
ncbi:MAG: integrase, partial [Gammaproteobacteria bacterium]|nr:integrase [Gammaproteobacteria bacterium]MBU1654097.1 integrase [Gammaproteobacteria bacterium]MBU1961378.1 integrase [Gammaproteobacteria bacterium]